MHGKGKEASLPGLLEFFHLLKVDNFNTANYMCWYKKVSLEIIFLLYVVMLQIKMSKVQQTMLKD